MEERDGDRGRERAVHDEPGGRFAAPVPRRRRGGARPGGTRRGGGRRSFGAGDLFAATCGIYFGQFVFWMLLGALIQLPVLGLELAWPDPGVEDEPNPAAATASLLTQMLGFLMQAFATHPVAALLAGRRLTWSASLAQSLRRLPTALGVVLVAGFAIGGFQALPELLGVPSLGLVGILGIILMFTWYVAPQVAVAEGLSVDACLTRSARLTAGHRWTLFLATLLAGLALALPVILLVVGLVLAADVTLEGPVWVVALWLLHVAVAAFMAVLAAVAYHKLLVAKEGARPDDLVAVFD